MAKKNAILKALDSKKISQWAEYEYENLDWLELDHVPEKVYNPLLDSYDRYLEDPFYDTAMHLVNVKYLHYAIRHILHLEPLPFQLVILDTLWTHSMPLFIASRGASKTFCLAIYTFLKLMFDPGVKVVVTGSAFRQSKAVFDYMVDIWDKAPVLQSICKDFKKSGPKRDIDRCEFRIGKSLATFLPLGTGEKIRGLRANVIISDETASVPEEIFNVVVQGFAMVSSNPIEKVKEAAMIRRMKKMGLWTEDLEKLKNSQNKANQIIRAGSAYYSFNHFCKTFERWYKIISSRGDEKKIKEIADEIGEKNLDINPNDFAIIRIPYTALPEKFLDEGIIAQAKATLNTGQFLMELGACFISDTNGFYKRSIIENATCNKPIVLSSGEIIQFSAMRVGNHQKAYVIAVDPAAEHDNAAIVVLEVNPTHRKVVHCWTTNRKRYTKYKEYMKTRGVEVNDDYYRYIAKKIRHLMRSFNTECIVMDQNGGGRAIAEALQSSDTYLQDEMPVYEVPDPENPKNEDQLDGLHILKLLKPTNEMNADANHGMLKDLQDRVLIFPLFDTVEMAKAIEVDRMNKIVIDTYEKLVEEIEELKNEMTTIVCTPTSTLGKENFDTPEIKQQGSKKGRLRKDRYSALLYANYYARTKGQDAPLRIQYKASGGLKNELSKATVSSDGRMYSGWGLAKFGPNVNKKMMGGMIVRKN